MSNQKAKTSRKSRLSQERLCLAYDNAKIVITKTSHILILEETKSRNSNYIIVTTTNAKEQKRIRISDHPGYLHTFDFSVMYDKHTGKLENEQELKQFLENFKSG